LAKGELRRRGLARRKKEREEEEEEDLHYFRVWEHKGKI
jgi:hypothetical protein